jgi:fatty-acyl-CoA synthase
MADLAHVIGELDTVLWDESIGSRLRTTARLYPDHDAVVDVEDDIRLSYAELVVRVDEMASAMTAYGITRGDRVGVWSPNRAESVISQFAIASIGAILVGINPSYVEAELDHVLTHAGIALVIAAPGHRDSNFEQMLESCSATGWQGSFVILDTPAWDQFLQAGTGVDVIRYADALAAVDSSDPFCLQYTSGTTGKPKGATITHHAALNNGRFIGDAMHMDAHDRLCVCLPFFHAFGIIACNLACMTHGATIVISAPTFNAGAVLATVDAERCTVLHGVPTMFIAELNHPDFATFDLSTLRTGLMGGAQCPLEVVKQVKDDMHLSELTVGFGMSELSSVTTQTSTTDPTERQVGSVGRVHPHLEAKVIDVLGSTQGIGIAGELVVRGYAMMTGYWDEPRRTSEVIDRDGWLHSGDLATIDAAGYVEIVGRLKDMILRGGENIYPREIEDVIHALPDIIDVQVVGVPDDVYGETVVAAVQVAHDSLLDEDALRSHCQANLSYFKVPQHFVFRETFPVTSTGKIRKADLRNELARSLTAAG